jgi:hypothetical protein
MSMHEGDTRKMVEDRHKGEPYLLRQAELQEFSAIHEKKEKE